MFLHCCCTWTCKVKISWSQQSASSSLHPPVEDVQSVYHTTTERIHRVELGTEAVGLLLLLLFLLLQVVVGGEGDAVSWGTGVRVELAGVEGREVSGQALTSQQGDVAEQLVNLEMIEICSSGIIVTFNESLIENTRVNE